MDPYYRIAFLPGDMGSPKKNVKEKYNNYKYNRIIFHPSENIVNIFFMVTSILKFLCLGFLISFVVFAYDGRKSSKWLDREKGERVPSTHFYVIVITLNMITLAEMMIKLHVGFIEESGKVVTYPYHVWQVRMMSDIVQEVRLLD